MRNLKRVESRKGESPEFVEFRTVTHNYVAQNCGGFWCVFKVERKGDGVSTIHGPLPKDSAIAAAEASADKGE